MLDRSLHIVVAASIDEMLEGVLEYPLLRDPFILVVPRGVVQSPGTIMRGLLGMPFLCYVCEQLISCQIEVHLARYQLEFEERFETGSHLALLSRWWRAA